MISTVVDNLGNNGYQTGLSLVIATAAIVAMLNVKVHRLVLVPVGIGAFWAGWLGWNTFTGQDHPLFPGDVSATKLWDVAFTSDTGFLLVVVVACIAAVLLWRKGTALSSKLVMVAGASSAPRSSTTCSRPSATPERVRPVSPGRPCTRRRTCSGPASGAGSRSACPRR